MNTDAASVSSGAGDASQKGNPLNMITPELIARINELARKSREAPLTEDELSEQARLRRLYIDGIKGQVKTHLDRVTIVDSTTDCHCGSHHKH